MTHLTQLLLVLVVIIIASKGAGALANRFGQPSVFGELLVGLLLGPSAVNLLGFEFIEHETIMPIIKSIAEIGVILLMFLAGFETDLSEMKKVGLAAFAGAIGGVFLPFAFGVGLSLSFGLGMPESIFIGTILTATSVSISAQTLIEMGKLRTKEGTTILGSAVIDDIMGIVILSVVVALTSKTGGSESISLLLLKMAFYFILAIGFSRFIPRLLSFIAHVPASQSLLAGTLVICFLYSFFAEYLGHVAAITGAYIAGVIIGQTDYKDRVLHNLEVITYSFFVPVFFVSIGLEANARNLGATAAFAILIIIGSILSKILGSGLGVKAVGFTMKQSLRVGTGMVSRGEVALIISSIGLTNKIIDHNIFSVMVVMTLVTTLITPILLRVVFGNDEVKS